LNPLFQICPCFGNLMVVPLLFLVNVASDKAGVLRISDIHEWPAKVLSHRMYLLISFRKSTPLQNRQLIVYYY